LDGVWLGSDLLELADAAVEPFAAARGNDHVRASRARSTCDRTTKAR
jgi:hypothetical protein